MAITHLIADREIVFCFYIFFLYILQNMDKLVSILLFYTVVFLIVKVNLIPAS